MYIAEHWLLQVW